MAHENDQAISHWPNHAQVMNKVGRELQAKYGAQSIPFSAITAEAEAKGCHGIQPSDYCYNRINRDPASFVYPLLEQVRHGEYRYLGPFFAYNGPIMWKPKSEQVRKVGDWEEGKYSMTKDPWWS